MTDIVERLLDWQDYEPAKMFCPDMIGDALEAADKIELLREEIKDLREVQMSPIPWALERDLRAEIERLRRENGQIKRELWSKRDALRIACGLPLEGEP